MTISATIASASASTRIAGPESSSESNAVTKTTNLPIVEEDWSQFMNVGVESGEADQHTSGSQDQSFAYYDTVSVPLSMERGASFDRPDQNPSNPLVMEIRCMKSLTPMDMLDLSNGFSDATGNRIWMGAVLFLECMVREIDFRDIHQESYDSSYSIQQHQRRALLNLRTKLFHDKSILELGAGTGAALIAVGMAGSTMGDVASPLTVMNERIRPSMVTFTDNDTNVLSLCQINCDNNLRREEKSMVAYRVGKLDWGEFCTPKNTVDSSKCSATTEQNDHYFIDSDRLRGRLDTVIATDVIYDVAAIPLLMATASGLLREGGLFLLAHVPRASIDCNPSQIRDELEELIISEAKKVGLNTKFSEQNTCSSSTDKDANSWNILFEGEEKEAAILRPSTLAQVWSISSESKEKNSMIQNNKKVLSVSSDYDYDELESCGASIMLFVKNSNCHSNNR